ncbi:MAG: permease [Deltaproteobacteria bacterium]|nr:permease [Deltaproteobacteria bacterium]
MSDCCVKKDKTESVAIPLGPERFEVTLWLPAVLFPPFVLLYLYLEEGVDWLVYSLLALDRKSPFTEALRFFIFEVPKVLMLLVAIVFVVGIIRSYFSPEKTRKALEGKPLFLGNVMASTLGIVTPFCSCSAIPLFIGFMESGIPLGVTFSFLIAAPMINEVALVLLFGLFGWKTALLYVATGLLIAITAGWVIGRLKVERFVEPWVYEIKAAELTIEDRKTPFSERIQAGTAAVVDIVAKVWIYIAIGIAVGAGVHGYVPENFMASLMGKSAWWSVPAAVLIGVPLYSNAAGIIPIIQALLEKGASLGTSLAFMMSVIGLSLPEMIILKKVVKLQLILVFAGVVASGIMVVGYLFNIIY